MRSGGSKAKGSSFERQIASLVLKSTERAGYHFSKEDIYRTPGSGGHIFAKVENPSDLQISRRLLKLFPFTVEAKHYRRIFLHRFALRVHKHKKSWMEKQAIDQVLRANEKTAHKRHPMVVMKENRGDIFAITTMQALGQVVPDSGFVKYGLKFKYKNEIWIIVYFKEFLRHWRRELRSNK